MKTKVEVIRPIRLPAGATLDGAVLAEQTWVFPGQHEIDRALLVEAGWAINGYVDPISTDGKPVVWDACCGDH
jgi:hypothetical protein